MMTFKFISFFLALVFLCFSSSVRAGWIIEQVIYSVATSSKESSKQKIKSKFYFSKNRVKSLQGNSEIIINYNSNQIFIVDSGRKLYWGSTIDEYISEIARSVAQSRKKLEESLKNMPPEQRKAIEEEMKKQGLRLPGEAKQSDMKVQVRIEKTPDKQTMAGYNATMYKIYTDGAVYQEIWVSDDMSVYKDIDMNKMNDFQNRVNETLSSLYTSSGGGLESSLEYQKLLEKGYPLKTVQVVGQNKGIIEVVNAKETEIGNSEFEVMKGFRKTTLEEVMKTNVGKETR
ncbi:MAG: hypothetical protein XU11_C0009G0037 [Candidatus Dadabacteria bacterium CSP1-2]|jgi:hypothetical protein|nr:MAG: hypothetical protein XU11_C0009G0037 [Candidatus Dadabacteria bacterium CSP1-2]